MTIETVQRLTSGSSRGQFIGRAGAATLALLTGNALGRTDTASAAFQHGCSLCDDTASPCPANVVCVWCWWGDCHVNPGGTVPHRTQCCEGYKQGSSCATEACGDHWACSIYGDNGPC